MYHYIRPESDEMQYLRHLSLDNFRKQLDAFSMNFRFITQKEFLEVLDGRPVEDNAVALSFDDGLTDHIQYVLPELLSRGLWGMFYIPTAPYFTGKLLDVHRTHWLLGKFGGSAILAELKNRLKDVMVKEDFVNQFQNVTYVSQDNSSDQLLCKKILNYFISNEWKEKVLDDLMASFFKNGESSLREQYYLKPSEICELQNKGMWVGSHSVSHPVFSKLSPEEQEREIKDSFDFLENTTGGLTLRSFCYPYGGFHSFTDTTERLLSKHGSRFALNVESRDAVDLDFTKRPQALPRFDCNKFPHGTASGRA